jgi:hypothetical protein
MTLPVEHARPSTESVVPTVMEMGILTLIQVGLHTQLGLLMPSQSFLRNGMMPMEMDMAMRL